MHRESGRLEIPDCLGPRVPTTQPSWRPPPGCWDMLFHVLGPQARFPYSAQRKYTPPDALLADYFAMLDRLGLECAVVTHANTQGPDNEIYLQAVAEAPDRLVAVIKAPVDMTLRQGQALHRRGARGMRFAFHPMAGVAFDQGAWRHAIGLARDLNWFLQMHVDDRILPELIDELAAVPVPIVLDHFARVDLAQGLSGQGARALLRLAEMPHIWIKLSGADRVSSGGFPYSDVQPLITRLLQVAGDRLLWGTDWPHTGVFDPARMPDDGLLFEAFLRYVPREDDRIRILRTNPRRLMHLPTWPGQ